jgi:hypothetical protein
MVKPMGANQTVTQALDGQVIAGIKKDLQNVPSLPLAGSTYTSTALVQLVQSRIDAANAVATARAEWLAVAAKYKALNANVTKVVRALRQYVVNVYGENSPTLADFGFTSPKRAVLTSEELALRAQKAAATRKARGTASKKQKAKIKGTVPVVAAPTTGTTPPAPTAPVVAVPVATPPAPTAPGAAPVAATGGAAISRNA